MAAYQIYNFVFDCADQGNCLATGDWRNELKEAQHYLQLGLPNLFTTKIKKKSAGERLQNFIECSEKGITSMLICNNKKHTYQEIKEERRLDYHPGCRVVIDNRPGCRQIAIESSSSFDRNTECVKKILERAFNRIMDEKGLKVEIRPMKREGQFFDEVEYRQQRQHDIISYVKLEVPNNAKVRQMATSENVKDRLLTLNSINEMFNARKGVYTASDGGKNGLFMDRKKAELAELVTTCIINGYTVSAKFKKTGIVKSTSSAKVIEIMDDKIIKSFINKERQLTIGAGDKCELEIWLDNIINSFTKYNV